MKKILPVILFLLVSLVTLAQQPEPVTVTGHLISEDLNGTIPLASMTNKSSGRRYLSNRQGLFRIQLSPSDTILISAIGYSPKQLMGYEMMPAGSGDTIRVILKPTVYRLKDVNIVYSNRSRDSIARLAAEFLKDDPLMNDHSRILDRNRGSMMSPLTAMYEAFSKEGADMVRFEEFLRYAEKQKAVDRRYNKKVIKRATGLPDSQLDDFIMFCKIDRDFILNAPEYDLILAIRKCNDDFQQRK